MKYITACFMLLLALVGAGCDKKPISQDGLCASMTDREILAVLHLNPASLSASESHGADGSSIIYTDEANEVWITRSAVTGTIVMRMKPAEMLKVWELGMP
tara:strand:- start:984 stop:1286 length:303 start_codon:yes stop_codon:yes gene_type:complete